MMKSRAAFRQRPRSKRKKKRRAGRARQRGNNGRTSNDENATRSEGNDEDQTAAASTEEQEQPQNAVENSEGASGNGSAMGEGSLCSPEGSSGDTAQLPRSVATSQGDESDGFDLNNQSGPSAPFKAGTVSDPGASHENLSADRFAGNFNRLPVFSVMASDTPSVEDDTKGHGLGGSDKKSAGDEEGTGNVEEDEAEATKSSKKKHVAGVSEPMGKDDGNEHGEEGCISQETSPHVPLLSPSDEGSPVEDRHESLVEVSDLRSAPSTPERSPSPVRRSRSFLSLPSFLPALPSPPSLRSGSTAGAVANLCGATLGAGVLSLPFAFSHAGLGLGATLLALAALSSVRSIDLLIKACDATGADGYEALAMRLCGIWVVWLVEGCIFVYCFGTAIAYIVAVGDMLQQGVIGTMGDKLPSFVNREFVMTLFWATIMFPLSLSKRIDRLRYASIVGIGSVSFLVAAAVIHSVRDLASPETPEGADTGDVMLWAVSLRGVLRACPIMIFAFSCQVNVCAIYHDLGPTNSTATIGDDASNNGSVSGTETPSKASRMARVTRLGVLVCISLYVLMGVFGYLDFGSFTQDNILKNYCIHDTRDPLMIFAFICITVTVVMAFPLNILPARTTIEGVLHRFHSRSMGDGRAANNNDEEEGLHLGLGDGELEEPLLSHSASASVESGDDAIAVDDHGFGDIDDDDFEVVHAPSDDDCDEGVVGSPTALPSQKSASDLRHMFLTLGISGAALLTALAVPDISVVFGLMGGTAACLISFVLPGTFALKVLAEEERSVREDDGDDRGDSEAANNVRGIGESDLCDENSKQLRRFEAWILIIGGSVIGILSTAVTLHSIFYEEPVPSSCSGDTDT
eukprot:CAMPEP_0197436832 /NCGR_PEP_ID=MMETSP1175-20131217/4205_1 /TAXON_ID=1003142 /ORGANISM="Triceratium dubium, Strain CCMP147" /LENGTH=858 /DNA_ID=CAMNT_0042966215 /DNA_START=8 /DNA_END=2584 /DNA_ORIENTATION=+